MSVAATEPDNLDDFADLDDVAPVATADGDATALDAPQSAGEAAPARRKRKSRDKADGGARGKAKGSARAAAREAEPGATERVVRRVGAEGVLIVAGLGALLLALALYSHAPSDPGWSSASALGQGQPVENLAGRAGAWWADVLLSLFGRLALALPLLVAAVGWRVSRYVGLRGDAASRDPWSWAGWSAGIVFFALAGCGLFALHGGEGVPPAGPGGVAGWLLAGQLAPLLGVAGATALLVAALSLGVSLFTGLSWLTILDRVGGWVLAAVSAVARVVGRVRDARAGRHQRREREVSVEQVRARRESLPAPQVVDVKPTRVEVSTRATLARQKPLFEPATLPTVAGELPSLALLDEPDGESVQMSAEALQALSQQVELKLADFGVEVRVVEVLQGPVVTRFELQPAPGLKVSKVTALAKDLARSLSTVAVRVVEVIPGKSVIGLELPNEQREMVLLSEILRSRAYDAQKSALTLALGKDVAGLPIVTDLAKMPHLLVAGTTGSGKSVAINAMILSLLFKASADDVRLIMIDPKMLELSVYEGIPHLLAPVVTDMKLAANALRWCVAEMERRYQLMSMLGVRNLAGFNRKVGEAIDRGEPIVDPTFDPTRHTAEVPPWMDAADPGDPPPAIEPPTLEKLPFVVVVVDELADMMMVTGKKCEELIARLAQKARASGIHLVLATQRPSVDVITGLIKANIPSRIAFQVSSKIDSRTIIDQMGAESLLGHGDMLYLTPGASAPTRVHGAFVSDAEVHRVVASLKAQGEPDYIDAIIEGDATAGLDPNSASAVLLEESADGGDAESDALYDEAVAVVTESRRASISYVQRRLKVGYNRAARMLEQMEATGVVARGPSGSLEVLAKAPPPMD